ncbi:MAG: AraC family transcriptional regulator [Planctomycetota bacterium]
MKQKQSKLNAARKAMKTNQSAQKPERNATLKPEPPFLVRTAGLNHRVKYHSSPGTKEGDYMLNVFVDGRGVYVNPSGRTLITKSMVGLVPPVNEGIQMADPDDPYVHYYCRFRGEYAAHLAEDIIRRRQARFFKVASVEHIADCIQRMGRIHRSEFPDEMGRIEALLADALISLNATPDSVTAPALNVESILQYLTDHIASPTSLDAMASHFFVSKSTLCRAMKSLLNATVQAQHETMKIDWAKTLLRSGTLNVTDVSLRTGYSDLFYFSRVFKKHTGVSPKQWQKGKEG